MSRKPDATGKLGVWIALLILICGQAWAASPPGTFTAITMGRSAISGNNGSKARQAAVADALAESVRSAFPQLMTGQVIASHLNLLYEKIMPRALDYVVSYRVLGEVQGGTHYLVAVESSVNLEKLEKTLADARIGTASEDRPVLLLLIVEQIPSDLLPRYWWGNNPLPYHSAAEQTLAAGMIQAGFQVIGVGPDRPSPSDYGIRFQTIYDVAAASRLGQEMKADLVVLGNAVSTGTVNRMGEEKTFDAKIEVAIYDLKTGKSVARSAVQAAVKSASESEGHAGALTKAAGLSADDLNEKINAFWDQRLKKDRVFELALSGEQFLPRFLALKQRFLEIPGFENLVQKEMGSDTALLDIIYQGTGLQFAEAVMLQTFDRFGLEITDASDERVIIRFVEKETTPGTEKKHAPE